MYLAIEKIQEDDRHIILSAMNLWTTLISEDKSEETKIDQ